MVADEQVQVIIGPAIVGTQIAAKDGVGDLATTKPAAKPRKVIDPYGHRSRGYRSKRRAQPYHRLFILSKVNSNVA